MKQIPCKANKCILYPICINKEVIFCRTLNKWLNEQGKYSTITWEYIEKYLKNVKLIREPDKTTPDSIHLIQKSRDLVRS